MNISSTELHEYRHVVVLSKTQTEEVLKATIAGQLDLPVGARGRKVEWRFEWGEVGVDSGLRKEPQIIVRVTHDLSTQNNEEPAPPPDGL